MRVLVVTVGGSPAPIISAYKEFEPDFTYFVCSKGNPPSGTEGMVDGEGDPCGDRRTKVCPHCGGIVPLGDPKGKCLVEQLQIPKDAYKKVILNDPDDLQEVYDAMLGIHKEVSERFRPDRKAICYTGGTKTMTAGAVLLGIRYPDWELAIERGPREDLDVVRRGNSWWPQDATTVYADIQVEVCKSLLSKYEYDTVGQLLTPLQMSPTLSREKRFRIQRLRQLCQAFSLWDRFEHEAALGLLEALGSPGIAPWIRRSKVLAGKVRKTNRFQIVADLVLNAERRVAQKKYVDAVARLYRAVEMLAQTRLVDKYQIDTGKVPVEKLPDVLRAKYSEMADESGNVVLSLQQAYELLMDLNDELGLYFQGQRKKIGNALHVRNQSISGHGVAPVTEERYAECGRVFEDFIRSGLRVCRADVEWTQLPGEELVELSEETR